MLIYSDEEEGLVDAKTAYEIAEGIMAKNAKVGIMNAVNAGNLQATLFCPMPLKNILESKGYNLSPYGVNVDWYIVSWGKVETSVNKDLQAKVLSKKATFGVKKAQS